MAKRPPIKVGDYLQHIGDLSLYKADIGTVNAWNDPQSKQGWLDNYRVVDITPRPEPKVVIGYVNVYEDGSMGYVYETRERADSIRNSYKRIACIRVEAIEGQFDD